MHCVPILCTSSISSCLSEDTFVIDISVRVPSAAHGDLGMGNGCCRAAIYLVFPMIMDLPAVLVIGGEIIICNTFPSDSLVASANGPPIWITMVWVYMQPEVRRCEIYPYQRSKYGTKKEKQKGSGSGRLLGVRSGC
ncbi:hypothetical protein BDW72DRAFT_95023 [Aspergillus terricola var. indicus]